jgi:hypothetical protein
MAKNSVSNEPAEKDSASSAAQTAESVFKNIQVLKGIPSDQLVSSMRFIAASLGVECSYCHVPEHFDKDDKKPKQIARDMMRMMFAIDKDNFGGDREVTCYSCHRGLPKPQVLPTVGGEEVGKPQADPVLEADKLTASLPTADQLVYRYISALGGAVAIGNITSRIEHGTATSEGQSVGIEIFDEGPDKQALVRQMPKGESVTVFDGIEGWSVMPGRPLRDIRGADLDAARIDADLQFPLHIKRLFAELRVEYPEKIGDREAYVVSGTREGQPPVKLYFDEHRLIESRTKRAKQIAGRLPGMVPPKLALRRRKREEQVDVSANGQGGNNNQYVVDGLDVTSGIRQGVLNLTPQPEAIRETSIQVNTFTSEYSRAAGLQTMFTTKSGSDRFHGSASDYFNYEKMFASQHYVGFPYLPFHSNNMDFAIGGPVIPHHGFYFYFAVEPLRSSAGTGGSVNFAAPEFIQFAQNTPALAKTVGTGLLTTYQPVGVTGVSVSQTAQDVLGAGVCGTAVADNIPCSTPMVDTGSFGGTSIRNGTQYFGRLDKDFKNDRIYASIFRTLLLTGAPSAMPQFSALNNTWQVAGQAGWTHTFSPTMLNEFTIGQSRVEGVLGSGATPSGYFVPSVTVNGINVDSNQAFGVGFAQGDFIQHNYHWRDVLTHVKGAHALKFGYEGWYGDDVEPFQGPWSQPKFSFSNLLTLAQDSPTNENGIYYNPQTGQEQLWSWDAASRTFGLFAEDTWKAEESDRNSGSAL